MEKQTLNMNFFFFLKFTVTLFFTHEAELYIMLWEKKNTLSLVKIEMERRIT